jgi:molybdopterin synthase catalytic subunit
MTDIKITADKINIPACIEWAMAAHSGAIDVFIGTVRDATKGKKVVRLEFEAYENMALNEMRKIAAVALAKWPVHNILIHHRTGILNIGEIAVVIVVSAAHRAAAFAACQYAIDTLKQTVPIWKKEVFEDGAIWVAAHP